MDMELPTKPTYTEYKESDMEKFVKSLSSKDIEKFSRVLKNEDWTRTLKDNIEILENNKEFVGKCYKLETKSSTVYKMIISAVALNERHVTAFTFETNTKPETVCTRDISVFKEMEYIPFSTESWNVKSNRTPIRPVCFKDWIEIEQIEFFDAMDEYYADLRENLRINAFDITDEVIQKEVDYLRKHGKL